MPTTACAVGIILMFTQGKRLCGANRWAECCKAVGIGERASGLVLRWLWLRAAGWRIKIRISLRRFLLDFGAAVLKLGGDLGWTSWTSWTSWTG
jgi:hypothetical protein